MREWHAILAQIRVSCWSKLPPDWMEEAQVAVAATALHVEAWESAESLMVCVQDKETGEEVHAQMLLHVQMAQVKHQISWLLTGSAQYSSVVTFGGKVIEDSCTLHSSGVEVGGVLHVRFAFASAEPVASTESVSLIQQRLARFEEEVHMPSQPVSGWATSPRADPGSVACVHLTNMHVGTEVSKLS